MFTDKEIQKIARQSIKAALSIGYKANFTYNEKYKLNVLEIRKDGEITPDDTTLKNIIKNIKGFKHLGYCVYDFYYE